jgi:hypothetical protein
MDAKCLVAILLSTGRTLNPASKRMGESIGRPGAMTMIIIMIVMQKYYVRGPDSFAWGYKFALLAQFNSVHQVLSERIFEARVPVAFTIFFFCPITPPPLFLMRANYISLRHRRMTAWSSLNALHVTLLHQ